VVAKPNVRWTSILQFVFVLLVCKATLWLLVLQLVVVATMNVLQMKLVTLLQAVASLARNAKPFVIQAIVLMEQIALPKITGKPAPADIL
jgi:hypothetical protein